MHSIPNSMVEPNGRIPHLYQGSLWMDTHWRHQAWQMTGFIFGIIISSRACLHMFLPLTSLQLSKTCRHHVGGVMACLDVWHICVWVGTLYGPIRLCSSRWQGHRLSQMGWELSWRCSNWPLLNPNMFSIQSLVDMSSVWRRWSYITRLMKPDVVLIDCRTFKMALLQDLKWRQHLSIRVLIVTAKQYRPRYKWSIPFVCILLY